jgi:hypothetical protein
MTDDQRYSLYLKQLVRQIANTMRLLVGGHCPPYRRYRSLCLSNAVKAVIGFKNQLIEGVDWLTICEIYRYFEIDSSFHTLISNLANHSLPV